MSQRFQLHLSGHDLADLRRAAQRAGLTAVEWARAVLLREVAAARLARQREALHAAAAHFGDAPGDTHEILRDIAHGREESAAGQ